jgi:Flp pilus assembly protein TadD
MKRAAAVLILCLGGCATAGGGFATSKDSVALRKQLAATLVAHRAWDSATQPLRDLLVVRPQDVDVITMLGMVYREQGLYEASEEQFRRAIEIDPKRASAWDGLGMMKVLRGDKDEGPLGDLRRAVELAPEVAAYYNNLGFALYSRGRDLEAVQVLRGGLARDPTVRRMRNNLGFAYGRLGQMNYAKREFYRANSAAEADNNLGYVYEQAGVPAAACELYHRAVQQAPTLASASENLVRACTDAASAAARLDAPPPSPRKRRVP